MSAPAAATTVVQHWDSTGNVAYFDESHWFDVALPNERKHASAYLWGGDPVTFHGDHCNGGYSVDYGGGEGISHQWRLVPLTADEYRDERVIGRPVCARCPAEIDGLQCDLCPGCATEVARAEERAWLDDMLEAAL